jgi:FG-GAP-like repeat
LHTFDASAHVDKNYRNFQMKLHDVDGDGLSDVVLVYGKQNGLRWMKQEPKSQLATPAILVNVKAPTTFDIQNMDGDNIPDLVVYSSTDSKIYQSLAVRS